MPGFFNSLILSLIECFRQKTGADQLCHAGIVLLKCQHQYQRSAAPFWAVLTDNAWARPCRGLRVATPKPRLVKLEISPAGEDSFTVGNYVGKAARYNVKVDIGGIGGLAPSRKSDLARLGFRALLAGSLVSFMTAAIAGILLG